MPVAAVTAAVGAGAPSTGQASASTVGFGVRSCCWWVLGKKGDCLLCCLGTLNNLLKSRIF